MPFTVTVTALNSSTYVAVPMPFARKGRVRIQLRTAADCYLAGDAAGATYFTLKSGAYLEMDVNMDGPGLYAKAAAATPSLEVVGVS